MEQMCRAVFILEEDASIPAGRKPLMLETMLCRPIMERAAAQCVADGVRRFFVVCPPRFAEEAAACFPEGTDVTVSEQQSDLLAFLDTDEVTLCCAARRFPLRRRVPASPIPPPGGSCGRSGRNG